MNYSAQHAGCVPVTTRLGPALSDDLSEPVPAPTIAEAIIEKWGQF